MDRTQFAHQRKHKEKPMPKTETIEIKMTWASAMPVIIMALQNGTPEGKRMAKQELMALANKLDSMNVPHIERLGA